MAREVPSTIQRVPANKVEMMMLVDVAEKRERRREYENTRRSQQAKQTD
jgi:hypothetical protein